MARGASGGTGACTALGSSILGSKLTVVSVTVLIDHGVDVIVTAWSAVHLCIIGLLVSDLANVIPPSVPIM